MSEPTLYLVKGGGARVPEPVDEDATTNRVERPTPDVDEWRGFLWGVAATGAAILFVLLLLGYAVWMLTEPPR